MRILFPLSVNSAVLFALTALPVSAAEQHNWNGIYAGGHVGGAWGMHDATIIPDINIVPPGTAIAQSPDGVLAGGQVGFNAQMGSWLLGIEGTVSWSDVDGSGHVDSTSFPGASIHTVSDTNWIATFVGRLGYTLDDTLLYVKGGVAYFDFDFRGSATFNGVEQGGASVSGGRTGWTIGAGIEFPLSPAWSARLEYDFYDFETKQYLFGGDTPIDLDAEFHTVQLGLNYHVNLAP